jgi:uncharacterized membrane protein YebE (DUF533 family)
MDLSTVALLVTAGLLLSALGLIRRHNRKQQEQLAVRAAETETLNQIELIRIQNPTEQDEQAYTLIETERQKVWTSLSTSTSIAPRQLYQHSFELIRQIAAIYHPDAEIPEFQASILDLAQLNARIVERVKDALDEFPLNTIKDISVQDILRYKGYYDKFSQFELIKLAKKHKHLYTVARYAWMGYNALNPWYWGRKIVLTAGKEGAFRTLLTTIITIVGEEAILVYGSRSLRAKATAVEKNIALEMINMAITDGVVSQEEYDITLDFILSNPHLTDPLKITLVKALARKKPLKSEAPLDTYDDKQKKRLLTQVERVAKADKLGLLKKRDALKELESRVGMTSEYRAQLVLPPPDEVESWNLMQQNRKREEAILRLMVQAGAIDDELPDSLRDYVRQRAESYPLPFDPQEQTVILQEAAAPTAPDTLTDAIVTKADKERTLTDVLDALGWYLPFTRRKEAFYTQIVAALDLKKIGERVLLKRLEQVLPAVKLVEKPPPEVLRYLCRLLQQDEALTALQPTATKYTFITREAKPKRKETEFWLCVTVNRVLVLAAATIDNTMYQHQVEFHDNLIVWIQPGRLTDTYVLQEHDLEIRLDSVLFRSSHLKDALQPYLVPAPPALEKE